jgi:hypothetical protein
MRQGDGVVDVAVPLTPGAGAPVVGVVAAPVDEVDVLVGFGVVVVLLVAVEEVVVTVVVGVVVDDVVVVTLGLDLRVVAAEPPKKVVGWPLPVIECPATRSGTVKTTTTIAKAISPVASANRHCGRQVVNAGLPARSRAWDCAASGAASGAVSWSGSS